MFARGGLPILRPMNGALPTDDCLCPDPLARAPRLDCAVQERLYPPPPGLQGAVVAIVCRDTRGLSLHAPQRLTHFPASPLFSLSWFQDFEVGRVLRQGGGLRWQPFGGDVVLAGSQSRPMVTWSPATGRGGLVCFTADVARSLFGLDPARLHDRIVPAQSLLGAEWNPMLEALVAAQSDRESMQVLAQHLVPRWQALHNRESAMASLRRIGRHWVERLAWQAHEWRNTHSPRQVERRVKAYSGRSLREWQALTRTEGLFFAARERHEAGQALDWAAMAQEEGFADQAHMSRETKRVTGFPPGEFARRFIEDESFWLYRLWV